MLKEATRVALTMAVLFPLACGGKSDSQQGKDRPGIMTPAKLTPSLPTAVVSTRTLVRTTPVRLGHAKIDAATTVTIPQEFPPDVFIYENARPVIAMVAGDNAMVTLDTEDASETVIEACKKGMLEQGWKEKAAINLPNGAILKYDKKERKVDVTISKAGEITRIRIIALPAQ